jgi:hypothetical protein
MYVLDLKTKKASTIRPENPEVLGDGFRVGREWRYIPEHRIAVIGSGLCTKTANKRGGKKKFNYIQGTDWPAYDPAKNRWLVLKLKGNSGIGGVDGSMHYDAKRKLFWAISSKGDVRVLKLDLEKAIVRDDDDEKQ